MDFILRIISEALHLLLASSAYMLFGLLISGIFRVFLNPAAVSQHLGQGRFKSVLKAALLGIPIPLCSCGVLPAAVSLKKQGATKGATTAFLISTPESGVDSIAVTYALLDPIMTVARPVAAFISAMIAGMSENLFAPKSDEPTMAPDLSCPVDRCCDGRDCSPEAHRRHHTFVEKVLAGLRYAFTDVWGDMAAWFFLGLMIAAVITQLLPADLMGLYLGGGFLSMLIMLAMGVPLYICATASTPIAAALILKGVSPGAALVFLLAGPATNLTSLTVILGVLGRRATFIYLSTIAVTTVLFGMALDQVYRLSGISAQAVMGQASELMPLWLEWACAIFLLALSVGPVFRSLAERFRFWASAQNSDPTETERTPDDGSGVCLKPT